MRLIGCTHVHACREDHTSLVKELKQEVMDKPGVMVLSVGVGGLLNGVVEGLQHADCADVPTVAMETVGAHSLSAAVKAVSLSLNLKLTGKQEQFYSEVDKDQEAVKVIERFIGEDTS